VGSLQSAVGSEPRVAFTPLAGN